jgi:hypothetical protein
MRCRFNFIQIWDKVTKDLGKRSLLWLRLRRLLNSVLGSDRLRTCDFRSEAHAIARIVPGLTRHWTNALTWRNLNLLRMDVSEEITPHEGRSIYILNLWILFCGTTGRGVCVQRFRHFLFACVKWLESSEDGIVVCARNFPRVSYLLVRGVVLRWNLIFKSGCEGRWHSILSIRLLSTYTLIFVTSAVAVWIDLHPIVFWIGLRLILGDIGLLDIVLGCLKGVLADCVRLRVHRLIVLFYNDTTFIDKICLSIFAVLITTLVYHKLGVSRWMHIEK